MSALESNVAQTGAGNISQEVNNFLSRNFIKRNLYASVAEKFATLSEDIPQNNGEVIKFLKWNRLTPNTTALTEGTTPSSSAVTKDDVTATVAQYGDWIQYTDILKISADSKPLQNFNKLLAEEAAEIKDILCLAELASATNEAFSGSATDTDEVVDNLDNDDLRLVAKTFHSNRAKPIKEMLTSSPNYGSKAVPDSFILITDVDVEYDLKEDDDFIAVEDYGSGMSKIHENEYGALKSGFRCIRSDHAVTTYAGSGSGGANVHVSIALAKDAYGITKITGGASRVIVKPLGYGEDPLEQRGAVGFKMLYVAKILNEDNIQVVQSAASDDSVFE